MRNLKLLGLDEVAGSQLTGDCIIAESVAGNLFAACGKTLRRFVKDSIDVWSLEAELFDLEDDSVVSFEATFDGFCAASKKGQIVTYSPTDKLVKNVGDIFGGIDCVSWSPDKELFVVVTGSGQLLLMRENFENVSEQSVECEELGEKSAITVGWGKKETQFHGSEGKVAAKKAASERETVAVFDDRKPYISWRNDGQFFVTNTVSQDKRTIRIWSRDGVLQYTAEPIPNLHGCLSWWWGDERWIVSVDSSQDKRRIIFFETNGLRHGQFDLPDTVVVKSIQQGTLKLAQVLTVHCVDTTQQESILLYTMNNYHWYQKQTLNFASKVLSTLWDSDGIFHVLTDTQLSSFRWTFQVDGNRSGQVASIDGRKLLVTNLQKFVIPPPMCQTTLEFDSPINAVASHDDSIAIHTSDGSLFLHEDGSTSKIYSGEGYLMQIHWTDADKLVAILQAGSERKLVRISASRGLEEVSVISDNRYIMTVSNGQLISKEDLLGMRVNQSHDDWKAFLDESEKLECTDDRHLIGFQANEKTLFFKDKVICSNATSYVLHGDQFILATTIENKLLCFPIFGDSDYAKSCDSRSLEIGSLLVTSAPVDGRLILQMPRGNIETIYPRPLMLHAINSHLEKAEYSEAFRLMKVNRINLNLFYDHNPEAFDDRIDEIVKQIKTTSHLNLFIMELCDEDTTRSMYSGYFSLFRRPAPSTKKNVGLICDKIREACERIDKQALILSIVTCYAKKNTDDDLEAALQAATQFPGGFDEIVKYLLLLVDVNRLMDVALGSYDFQVFLKVAQQSQKDPKEYLATLNELKSHGDENYRRFCIEKSLKRYGRALKHLAKCPGHLDEALELIIKERLFIQAEEAYRGTGEVDRIWLSHGDYLITKKHYKDAGICYIQAKEFRKASQCFERSLSIRLCLDAARKAALPIKTVVERLVNALVSEKKFEEATELMKRYEYPAVDICRNLIEGRLWENAYSYLSEFPADAGALRDDCEKCLREELAQASSETLENIRALSEKITVFVSRLVVIRKEKSERLTEGAGINFYDDIDLPTSEAGSMVSGRSGSLNRSLTGTYKSGSVTTKQSNRQARQKMKKPRYALKEGSPYEDLAIVQECFQLIEKFSEVMRATVPLIYGLQLITQLETASEVQSSLSILYKEIKENSIPTIWPEIAEDAAQVISDVDLRKRPVLPDELRASTLCKEQW